jgi:ankyrin repeat protein
MSNPQSAIPSRALCLIAFLSVVSLAAAGGNEVRLADAVKAGNRAAVRELLKTPAGAADVNAREVDGTTALHWAVRADDVETVRLLLTAGAKVNAANRYGVTALSVAATNGSAAIIDMLLKSGADANAALLEGETVLMTAARTGRPDAVKLLLDHGADSNARERGFGETALMWAAAQNHQKAMEVLIDRGADLNARSTALVFSQPRTPLTVLPRGGWTPLMFAARQGAVEAARTLARVGADLDVTDPDGTTALVLAVINTHYELAALLLDHGADTNVADTRGMAALYAAVDMHTLPWLFGNPEPKDHDRLDSLDIVKMLLDHGADPNARLKAPALQRLHTPGDPVLGEGTTPFMRAAKSGDVAVMRLLLDRGADPLRVQTNQTTALIIASGLGWQDGGDNLNTRDKGSQADAIEAIKLCLDRGLDIHAVNDNGTSVLHAAATRGQAEDIIRFLAEKGARADAKNRQGQTALDVALARRGQDGAVAVVPSTVNILRELLASTGAKTTAQSR